MTRLDAAAPDLSALMLRWFDEYSADGIATTDTALVVRSWNRWLATTTGVSATQAIGRPLMDLFPVLVERGLDQAYAAALDGHVSVLSHTLHRFILPAVRAERSTEQMRQSARIAPLYDGTTIVGTITVIEDVSDRVAREDALRAQIAASEHARSIAETASRVKDEFLATLSHEIRTPLNAVLGWTRILLARENPDPATVKRAIEVIDRNASAQLTLIGDMLDLARIATGKIRLDVAPLDMAMVVLSAVDVVRPAADAKGVRLVTDLAPQLPALSGDADRLQQVVWNLLSNAVKFTDKGGSVTIGLSGEGNSTRLVVADTGQGVEASFLPTIFQRFTQADPSASRRHGGLGIGLALVKELTELHGGSVMVDSPGTGKGTTFTLVLPGRAIAPPVSRARLHALAPAPTGHTLDGIRILIVEDDADALEIAARTVTDAGASVIEASSVAAALSALRANGSAAWPHIVITDIGMPRDDGFTLLREMRELSQDAGEPQVPAIAVTAYATPEDRRRALDAGFASHLAKPYAPKVLVTTIARVVASVRS